MAPLHREGFWGEATSTLDWCEENYVVTRYIAEFCEYQSGHPPKPAAMCGSAHPRKQTKQTAKTRILTDNTFR